MKRRLIVPIRFDAFPARGEADAFYRFNRADYYSIAEFCGFCADELIDFRHTLNERGGR